jgi:hypothetical protein
MFRELVLLVGPFAAIIGVVVIVRAALAASRTKREAETLLQLHTRLIEKFGTSQELLEYLRSEAGAKLLSPVANGGSAPHRKIIAAVQVGVIMTFLGTAFWLLRGTLTDEGMAAVSFLGAATLALGLGFLVSAFLAYLLSSRWGLLNGKRRGISEGQ